MPKLDTPSTPMRGGHAGRGAGVHAAPDANAPQAPINAADAAHRAARAGARELDRLRRDAAGHAVRAPHGERPRANRMIVAASVLAGIALAALVLYGLGSAVVGALLADGPDAASSTAETDDPNRSEGVARVAENESMQANGYVYSIVREGDGYVFGYQYPGSDADPFALFEIPGDPVGFALYQGVFYVLSNADGAYCVQSYVHSDGSVPGDYYHGEGTMTDLELDGAQLVLTDDAGRTYTLELASGE